MSREKMASSNNFRDEQASAVDRLINTLEKDSRGFGIITYGLTSIGLLTALSRIRPFAKFSSPKKVPSHFIKNQTLLKGTAARIEPGKPCLILVNHKPLINIPRFGEPKYLPVKVAGVDVTSNGLSWLSTIIQGREIEFVPIRKSDKYLECTVTIGNKNQVQIGEELIKLGFGTVEEIPLLPKNDLIHSYEKSLLKAQQWAMFERNGHWHFTIPRTITWRIKRLLYENLRLSSWYQAPLRTRV